MAAQHTDFALHLAEVRPGLWNWRLLGDDGEAAVTGDTTTKETAYQQGELFRRYLCRFSAERGGAGRSARLRSAPRR
ncbi:hypothetical protein ER13_08535 [Brevundimonas sp. EAKA]|jgi:hypothetical protein|uniref:DUF1508 domain-containing protein n=1 Tax=Brevundimonas mediterranea TaxID=74329 RepID=A0A7Z8Y691_9CAUL|nr:MULTISPECIES: hypothetical protein [Brevundimonas]KDP94897.1 hypothetical protein ER13_08535 [Brevundimonas sp. EAKA]MBU4195663.1 hypothetical protein [Alphaproteobacteria bacterium]VDC51326.1 hypothetical protein BREV_BREV_02678 [Brevundimonas mediterranea]